MTIPRKRKARPPLADIPPKPWRKEKIRLRLADMPPKLVAELKCDLPGGKIKTNERRAKDKNKLVALLELDDSIDCEKLCQFINKNKIPRSNYMLCISLLTEGYMGGVRVPEFVIYLLCRLGCELNFSFIKI
jgi:hypothetical protein